MITAEIQNDELIVNETETQDETEKEYDASLLNFLDYIVLMLTQADSAEEVDLIMDDFLSEDVKAVMSENRLLFSAVPVIWLSTFERIFMRYTENDFPLKILALPVFFNELDWKVEDQSKLDQLHKQATEEVSSATTLYPYLVLLFLEGSMFNTKLALANFREGISSLSKSKEDDESLEKVISDISSLKWDN